MKIKVCGIRDSESLEAAMLIKPDFIGHIFYSKSPRNINFDDLPNLLSQNNSQSIPVAVLVNPSLSEITDLLHLGIRYFQLHGQETAKFCWQVKSLQSEIKVWKAFGISADFNFERLEEYQLVVDCFLFDTKTKLRGGSGVVFDWSVLNSYQSSIPYFLSGGINPTNYSTARAFARQHSDCVGLDLNSGFESSPGIKSPDLLKSIL